MRYHILIHLALAIALATAVEDYRAHRRRQEHATENESETISVPESHNKHKEDTRHPTSPRHHQHHHGHHHRSHGNRGHHELGRSRWLPDWAAPWLKGSLDLPKAFNIDWDLANFFNTESREWWKGPNVCVSREESEEDLPRDGSTEILHHHFSSSSTCDETETSYICTTEVTFFGKKKYYTVVYECCHGFQRTPGSRGCPTEIHLEDLKHTTRNLDAGAFMQALTSVGLDQMLLEDNYTLFAPIDNAFQKHGPRLNKDLDTNIILVSPEVQEMAQNTRELLLAHVASGMLKTSKFTDELLLETENPRSHIRINIYDVPRRLLTANCKVILTSDVPATNGMLHVVDGVLEPVTSTLMELVSKDPELSTLKTMLGRIGLGQTLRSDGQYTLFAPTNAAFKKLKPALLQKLLEGNSCLSSLVENHLLPHVICSSIIQGRVKTRNVLSNYLNMTRTGENKLFVNAAQMVTYDVMATNGALHVIDAVLVPDEALDVLDVAEKAGATEFLRLVDAAGLTKTLQRSENYTLFIPTNQAVMKLADDVKAELSDDPMALEKIVKYHIIPSGERAVRHLYNNLHLDTLDSEKEILVKEYYSAPFGLRHQQTVQCAPIRHTDMAGCNGMAHIVDQMLLPPKGDLLDVLSQHANFSRFVRILKKSGMAEFLQQEGPYTVLAPTDQAIEALDQNELLELENRPDEIQNFAKYHIMRGTLCCAGIFQSNWLRKQLYYNQEGSIIHLRRHGDDIFVNRQARIARCDLTATNGVVHGIGSVLPEAWRKYTELMDREDSDDHRHDTHAWNRQWDRTWERMRDWDWLDMGWKWNKGK